MLDSNEMKEKEIKRLTESMGKEEPIKGILTDEEILKYAGESKTASRIRLKQGENDFQDKLNVYGNTLALIGAIALLPIGLCFIFGLVGIYFGHAIIGSILTIIGTISTIIYFAFTAYFLLFKDYTEQKVFTSVFRNNKPVENENSYQKNVNFLEKVFNAKVKIVKDLIEEKFPAPQLTNTKFNNSIDECSKLFNSQLKIINQLLTVNSDYSLIKDELDNRLKLLQKIITVIDELTNELIIKIGDESTENVEDILENMNQLIKSIKYY